MNKVIGCLMVALALGIVLVIDVVSIAPAWTVYMEWVGLILAVIAAILYYLHYRKLDNGDGDDPHPGNGQLTA